MSNIYKLFLIVSIALLPSLCTFGQDTFSINPYGIGETLSFVFNNDNSVQNKHLNAKTWVAKTFGDYKSVIQFEDDDNHKLIIKGHAVLPDEVIEIPKLFSKINVFYTLLFTITIDSKDDRYRILFEDISVHSRTESYILGERKPEIDKEADRLVSEYCEPYVPDTQSLEKRQAELDSLRDALNKLPEKLSTERQRRNLKKQIEEKGESIAESVLIIESTSLERQKRYDAIFTFFNNMVSSFKAAVERSDDF